MTKRPSVMLNLVRHPIACFPVMPNLFRHLTARFLSCRIYFGISLNALHKILACARMTGKKLSCLPVMLK